MKLCSPTRVADVSAAEANITAAQATRANVADIRKPSFRAFAYPESLLEMAERWGESRLLEDKQALEYAITKGRGSLWLKLTPEEYAKLR